MVPRAGQRVGPYEILGDLGSGGMGLVFSAWDARLQRDVAIKLLRDEYCTADMKSRFLQEARAASALNHPHICTIFDIGEQGGDPYLVMELLKGQTLRARIMAGEMPAEDILKVATETADALAVAHERGVIHRDIKPANIMLVDKGAGRFNTKVLDFGLAKVDLGERSDARLELTSAGATVGTVSYMSPEQARGEALDARSDLFSLGVVMYEMATGQVPFQGATSAVVFVRLLGHAPEPVRELNEAIPKKLERVILKLLAKDRTKRYQTADELVEALREIEVKPAGKSLWGAWPGLVVRPKDQKDTRDQKETKDPRDPKDPKTTQTPSAGEPDGEDLFEDFPAPRVEPTPARPRLVGEHLLRPVHRIASSHPLVPRSGSSGPGGAGQAQAAAPEGFRRRAGDAASSPVAVKNASSAVNLAAAGQDAAEAEAGEPTGVPAEPATRQMPMRNVPWIEEDEEDFENEERTWGWGIWVLTAVVLGLAVLAVWLWRTRQAAAVSGAPRTVVLASLINHTGDEVLSGVLAAGLEIDLEESPHLIVRDGAALAGSLQALDLAAGQQATLADARRAAAAVGATDILFGDLRSAGSSYSVSLRVYQVATEAKVVEVTETAPSREQIPDAIDRLAADVRLAMGESGEQLGKTSVPLARQASSNLDALAAYITGTGSLRAGHFIEAMHALEKATAADGHFTQAYIELAKLYGRERAGIAATAAVAQAQNSAQAADARTRLLVQATYGLLGNGNVGQAAAVSRQLLAMYPGDVQGTLELAMALRQQGHFAESLEMCDRVLQMDPYDPEAAGVSETDLLALDRPGAAAEIEARLQRSGQGHAGLRLLINYLGSRDDGQEGTDVSSPGDPLTAQQAEATVLDAGGLLEGGLEVWRQMAARASANPELLSAASEALASAALDRALVDDCTTAQSLQRDAAGYPQAAVALFNSGMSAALCGDLGSARKDEALLERTFPEALAVTGYFGPDLNAVIQWKSGDEVQALDTLESARNYDRISLTPYLRGLIHLRTGESKAAVVDFEAILEHRGATTLTNPVLFAMAQIGVARAYTANGDLLNAAASYKKFLVLWSAADENQELVREARAGSQYPGAPAP